MPYANQAPFLILADLGAYLRRDLADDDQLAIIACDSASHQLREAAGLVLYPPVTETILVDSAGTDILLLPELPVTDVLLVSASDVPLDADTDYFVSTDLGALVKRHGRWIAGRGVYEVTYTHGWEEVPNALRVIALTLAARIYDQGLVQQETVGGSSVTYAAGESLGFSKRELDVIAKFRPGRKPNVYQTVAGSGS